MFLCSKINIHNRVLSYCITVYVWWFHLCGSYINTSNLTLAIWKKQFDEEVEAQHLLGRISSSITVYEEPTPSVSLRWFITFFGGDSVLPIMQHISMYLWYVPDYKLSDTSNLSLPLHTEEWTRLLDCTQHTGGFWWIDSAYWRTLVDSAYKWTRAPFQDLGTPRSSALQLPWFSYQCDVTQHGPYSQVMMKDTRSQNHK